jgi:hypothetical protein
MCVFLVKTRDMQTALANATNTALQLERIRRGRASSGNVFPSQPGLVDEFREGSYVAVAT